MYRRPFSLILVLACAGTIRAQVDVLTANYDNNRTNANMNEGILNTNNVNPGQFGKLYAFPVDGQIYAQPLYVHGLNMPGKGTLNVLYVATMHNSVYAFDADRAETVPLWHVNLGVPVNPTTFNPQYQDIMREVGILSTPVIDRTGNTIYVVDETVKGGQDAFFLHGLDLTTGAEKLNGPVQIEAKVPGNGWGGSGDAANGELSLQAAAHLQRTGLLLANDAIYAGFGSHGDITPWHGWIVAYSATDLQQQTAAFSTTPSSAGSAIWQGGRGLVADPNGDVYCSTGNGNYDGVESWGETVLRLTPALDIADWFTPDTYAGWTEEDADFGSSGPMLVPGTNLLIAGGKAGLVAVMDRTNMGRELSGDKGVVQTFQAIPGTTEFNIFNAALWNGPDGPMLYLWAFHDGVREFQMQNGTFNPVAVAVNSEAQNALPFSGMSVSSNGAVPGTGIFWATAVVSQTLPALGTLHAFDASDVGKELWNSDMAVGKRDTLGMFTKFVNPTVANGKIYAATDGQVTAYGLLPVPGIQAVVNAASFSSSTIAPGELVTIFGVDIGPTATAGLTLDSQGHVSTLLKGYRVTFDGEAAPLLYVSQNQINVVVPFSAAGKSTTELQVTGPTGTGYSVSMPVSAAAPAIFTIGTAGQGAVLNGDYSINSATHPAARGSSIAIYATGTGVLNPAVADGTVVSSNHPPASAATVKVTIGGLPATVSYQGAAPGLVAGVMQINAEVPAAVTPGSAVPVTISAGTSGLNTVTVAVQ